MKHRTTEKQAVRIVDSLDFIHTCPKYANKGLDPKLYGKGWGSASDRTRAIQAVQRMMEFGMEGQLAGALVLQLYEDANNELELMYVRIARAVFSRTTKK